MPIITRRILHQKSLATDDAMDIADTIDLGECATVDIVVVISEAGEGETPVLVFEHAPINDPDSFFDFSTPATVDLTASGRSWFHITACTRYLRWRTTGTLSASAVVTVDLVARG